jgi:hypothetical protein
MPLNEGRLLTLLRVPFLDFADNRQSVWFYAGGPEGESAEPASGRADQRGVAKSRLGPGSASDVLRILLLWPTGVS